jgi:LCP family protein required for cell wall assembly
MSLLLLIFVGYVSLANIVPFKYMVIIFLIVVLWDLSLYFTLVFKTKIGKNKKRKLVGYIISVFLIILMGVVSYYLTSTMSFFRSFGKNQYKEENYLILVKNDSNYEKIEDLDNMGYVKQELGNIDKAIEKVQEKKSIEMIEYEQYNALMVALIDSKIQSLIIEESYYQLLDESLNYSSNFRVLDTISIITKLEDSSTVDVTKNTFSIYISGIDTYGNISGVSRSDVNMLITVNPVTKQILFVSIPRDYYVQLRGTTGYKDKLTHAGVYGIDMSIGTIEDLLDVEINYYFRVNFSTLEQVIDAIDGVDVYSQYDFTSSIYTGATFHFSQGYNHLNGVQALSFSRERYNMPHGDRDRGVNQQAVLDGVIRKVTSSAIITKYTAILNSLKDTFQTNMTENDIQKLIKMQLNDMASWNITSYSLDGYDGEYEYTYSHPFQKLYVMHPYEDTITEGKSLIDRVYNGEVLESSYGTVSDIKDPVSVTPSISTTPSTTTTPSTPTTPTTPTETFEEPTEKDDPIEDLIPDGDDSTDDSIDEPENPDDFKDDTIDEDINDLLPTDETVND